MNIYEQLLSICDRLEQNGAHVRIIAGDGRPAAADQVRPKVLAHQRNHLVVVDVADHHNHHAFRHVAPPMERRTTWA